MKKLAKAILPEVVKKKIIAYREITILPELKSLNIEATGVEDDLYPWIKLKNGFKFYGFFPTLKQKNLYQILSKKIPNIPEECFGVAYDIINRYAYPRSIPGLSLGQDIKFTPLRDPINDFDTSDNNIREMVPKFIPKKGGVFVDAGAYLGFGTMRIAEYIGSTGKIIAFESDPTALTILQKNLEANNLDMVQVVPKAVSDKEGAAEFFTNEGTINSLNKTVLNKLGHTELKKIKVDVTTGDIALKAMEINQIDHLNITVNGAEHKVLQGMKDVLSNSQSATVTLAGWYYVDDRKVWEFVKDDLKNMNFNVAIGHLGRVLAWK